MKKLYSLVAVLGISIISVTNAQIVINEIYGGGGNSGAPFKADFIELINNSSSTVTLTGAYLHYASSTGTFNSTHSLPSITLTAGQTYLVQEGTEGPNGFSLPTSDATGPFNLSGTKGKVALTSDATPPTSPTDANVLDFVGFGSANQYEGTGATAAPSNTTSVSRSGGLDSNDNSADFSVGTPTPSNTTLAVNDITSTQNQFVKNTSVQNEINFGAKADVKIYSMNGQIVKSASVSENKSLEVADLASGMYIVTGTVEGQAVSTKIIKK